jgi:hypothetical protein
MIKLTYTFKGQYININDITFRRIWSEYDDVVLWDRYNKLNDEWKSVRNEHYEKLEMVYNKSIETNVNQEIEKILEFLKT